MALTLTNVRKVYVAPDGSTVPVIDVPTLFIGDGEQVAFIGSSGSGKTTLLHLIAGILTPDSGQIVYAGGGSSVDIAQLSEAERDIFRGGHLGYVFQTHHLLSGFTALENVLLGMSFTGRSADTTWAEHLLKEVGLGERLHYKPGKLSVGQQQRVAVARALAGRPRLVLADEPTGALDARNAQQVLDLMRNLCSEVGAALLIVTHDLNIAKQMPRTLSLTDVNRAAAPG
ncbi:MAG: ABC transporter ATP-binding protein [Tepidisphaeraceae bacterium]